MNFHFSTNVRFCKILMKFPFYRILILLGTYCTGGTHQTRPLVKLGHLAFLRTVFHSPNSSPTKLVHFRKNLCIFAKFIRICVLSTQIAWSFRRFVNKVPLTKLVTRQTRPFLDFKAPLTKLGRPSLVRAPCTRFYKKCRHFQVRR